MRVRNLAIATSTLLLIAATTVHAGAQPVDHFRFHDHEEYVMRDVCGRVDAAVVFDERGMGRGRVTHHDQLRYTVTHHGSSIWTNTATGRSFTFVWNYLDEDMRVTVHKNGTMSVLGRTGGSERIYGPDHELLDVHSGLTTWIVIIDYHGTLLDPRDDEFVRIRFLTGTHGLDVCAVFPG